MEETRPEINKELFSALVKQAADTQAYGSYSARNPQLGKMITCPQCCRRKRQVEFCCEPKYITTNAAMTPKITKTRKNPRLSRNRPPMLEIHQRLVEMGSRPGYVEFEGISGIVEAEIKRRKKSAAKRKRKQQRKSRKNNRVN